MMLESGPIRPVRPFAAIRSPRKSESTAKLSIEPRDTFWPIQFLKYSGKAFHRALFLTWGYNTKSQKSKKLPGKSKFYKVPHKHGAGNCKNRPARAIAA
jgi:hypothetical protein